MSRAKSPIIVKKSKKIFAIALLNNHKYKNLKFYTKNKVDFQLATMLRPKNEMIQKHEHFKESKTAKCSVSWVMIWWASSYFSITPFIPRFIDSVAPLVKIRFLLSPLSPSANIFRDCSTTFLHSWP